MGTKKNNKATNEINQVIDCAVGVIGEVNEGVGEIAKMFVSGIGDIIEGAAKEIEKEICKRH